MAQNPVLADQVKIEPGASGTRLIDRDPSDGSLRFTDPNTTAVLSALLGIRNVTDLYLVGPGGTGAPYTAIQDALDAVPDIGTGLIVVMGGSYTENITISKDNVSLVGLGKVTLTNDVADATVTIIESPTSIPENVLLQNLVVINTEDGEECVLISGANNYADGTFTVGTAPLTAGDTLTIGGLPLTGVAGSRTSGNDDFSVDGVTVSIVAAEIAAAINDPANSFSALVVATAVLGVVTITAQAPGAGGNAITIASSTGDVVASGATLTGGGTTDSRVGYGGIDILDCVLQAQGNGGFQVRAETVNNVRVRGGTWRGSSSTSQARATQCASFRVFGVEWMNDVQAAYDSGGDQPAIITSVYEVSHVRQMGSVLANLLGEGSLTLDHLVSGSVAQGGDRLLNIAHSSIGALVVNDTTEANLDQTSRGVATGTGTLAETMATGIKVFAASASEPVVFAVPQPDAVYSVLVSASVPGSVTAKTAAGFTILLTAPVTETVFYTITRQM